MLMKLFKLLNGNWRREVDDDVEQKRQQWKEELARLELLAAQSRLQNRDWHGSYNKPSGSGMDSDRGGGHSST